MKKELQSSISDSQRMNLLHGLGSIVQYNDNKQAILYGEQLLQLANKKKDTSYVIFAKAMIGSSYYNLGALDKALKLMLEAYQLSSEFKSAYITDYIISNLAITYDEMGNYEKASEYYHLNLRYGQKNKLADEQIVALFNLADMYTRMEAYDSAIYYAEKSIEFEQLAEEYYTSIAYINYGNVLVRTNQLDKALKYLQAGIDIQYKDTPDFSAISEAYVSISSIYENRKQFKKAIQFADSSVSNAIESESRYFLRKAYENRSHIYKQIGDFQKAFEDLKLFISTNDEIYNEETTKKFLELQELYEAKERETQIDILKQETKISKESITRKNIVILGSLLILLLLILLLVIFISRIRLKQKALTLLKSQKEEIENTNFQLGEMTEELKSQKEEIETHRDQLSEAYSILEKRNKDVTDSINYAQKIQNSLLPELKVIKKSLPKSFIFYEARDIVSGDFYWFHHKKTEQGEIKFIASIDCTGHGVPGAFMSMIADALLSQIIIEMDYNNPADILGEMDRRLRIMLKQEDSYSNDGMEIGLCAIHSDRMYFAGAGHRLIYFKNNEMHIIRGNRFSIGETFVNKNNTKFEDHCIQTDEPLMMYLFSDGFQDQFGGANDKKFGIKRLRLLLDSIHDKDIDSQEQQIKASMKQWKGNTEQVDDMLLIGVHLS